MKALNRDDILNADDLPRERVDLPEWGGYVYVRTLTGQERDLWELAVVEGRERQAEKSIRARLAVSVVVDESGKSLFAEADIPALSAKSCAPLDRIFDAADRLNHITRRDIRELAKNSGAASGDDSASA